MYNISIPCGSPPKIIWLSQISTRVLNTPDLLPLASKAGCLSLIVGVESINQSSLDSVNKGFNNIDQYEELIKRMREVKIEPHLSFIFGFDHDTPEQFEHTMDFLVKNDILFASFWILTPLPGTELFSELQREGRITVNDWSMYDLTHVVFEPRNFTKDELVRLYWKFYQDCYSVKWIPAGLIQTYKSSNNLFKGAMYFLFYFSYFRNKVKACEHPLSGGIGRIK